MTAAKQRESATAPEPVRAKKARPSQGQALVSGARLDVSDTSVDLDAALSLMAAEIEEWLNAASQRLQEALSTYLDLGGVPPRTLMHTLQDLRGQAGNMGFPLISRAAGALYRLLEKGTPPCADILVAHVDAIRAIIGENARGDDNPIAMALVAALEEFGRLWHAADAGNTSESSLGA